MKQKTDQGKKSMKQKSSFLKIIKLNRLAKKNEDTNDQDQK